MSNKNYMLGQFVYLVQAMEETQPNVPQKGTGWGEQILTLLTANLESTLQMMVKIISGLPDSVTIASGETISHGDLHHLVLEIDFSSMSSEDIVREDFLDGYEHPFGEEVVEEEKNSQSYYLGVFMGTLFCLEQAVSSIPLEQGRDHGEDSFLLVNINFNTAMQMAEKTISSLPQTAELNGKSIALADLEKAYLPLEKETLGTATLSQEEFVYGFDQVLKKYFDI